MESNNRQIPSRPFGLRPAVLGTICCVIAALGYTAANICLRKLAELKADEMWVTCMKEVVTVSVIGPWLVIRAIGGVRTVPPPGVLARLMLVGLAVQLFGNLCLQWAYGVVGIAISIAAVFGVMLTASALLGFLLLGERVSGRSMAAMALLIAAIVLLRLGADDVNRALAVVKQTVSGSTETQLGIAAACLAGAMFAALSITLRHTAGAGVPVTSIVFIVTGMGVLSMGALSLWRIGPTQLAATPPEHLAWMLAAGGFNLIAFLAITKGLQLMTVVHASLLNASQVALGALAGIVLFSEPMSRWLIFGVALTIVGMMLIDLPSEEEPEVAGA